MPGKRSTARRRGAAPRKRAPVSDGGAKPGRRPSERANGRASAARSRGDRRQVRGKRPGHESDPRAATERSRRFVASRVEVEGREEVKVVEIPAFEPEAWGAGADLRVAGRSAVRADAVEKVTGRARYTVDVQRPGMLHAVILRAAVASGRVARLDLAPARAAPGVRDAIARADIPEITVEDCPLFDPVIRFAGQPVAAVCAESEEAARRGLAAVRVEYETWPHALAPEDALAAGAPRVRGRANRTDDSPRITERGDVRRGLARAAVTVTREYRTPVALHTALEPHGTVAEWDGARLTVWESTQGIFAVRRDLAEAFGLPHSSVRVITEYMGGGFGAKNGAHAACYVAAALARRVGRAVRCVHDREAEQTDAGNRPATVQRVTLGARRDGRLTAIALEAAIPLGVGGWEGGPGAIFHELYACPNVRTAEDFVYINASAMSSFRAPGHVEGAFALECAMDALARALGMDPLELRLRNYAARDQRRGRPYTGKRLDECYRVGAERFGWGRRGVGSGPVPATPRLKRGFGMASQIWGTGGGPPAYATVRVNGDGTVEVQTGSQDLGTGSRTIFAQIAAEALGARLADVRVVLGDTERGPYTGNSWGSMTTPSVGPAVRMAAEDARSQLFEAAAGLLDTTPDRLESRDGVIRLIGGGRSRGRNGARRSISFARLGEELGDVMIIGRGSRGPNPDGMAVATFGAQFAEVEVDAETGVVRVERIVSVHDAGRIINPALAESQLQGGIIQGIGYALFEERVLDRRLGLPLNPTMHDYKIPTMRDVPVIEAFCLDGADPAANHTGARGLAEPPIIPTAPAIANAVADALGVEVTEIPLTPWRVLEAMRGA